MKVLHVTHTDRVGGAAIAAFRLHASLRQIGVNSRMAVWHKTTDDADVLKLGYFQNRYTHLLRNKMEGAPKRLYPSRQRLPFSSNHTPSPIAYTLNGFKPDILNLHWIGNGMLPMSSWARLKAPVVWTLHDSWAFTGGCHIPYDCRGYEGRCGRCPMLGSSRENDLSRWIWNAKALAFPQMQPTIVTPSTWMADCARRSSLLRDADIRVIPHGLDLTRFALQDQAAAREALGLTSGRALIAFGAMWALEDFNKGADLLTQALEHITVDADFLIFGSDRVPDGLTRRGFAAGILADERDIAQVYCAADVMIVPSRSESFSLAALESLACGTPVVAFRIGGIPDLVEHGVNGYLAEPFDTADLARGIQWVLEDPDRHARLRQAARAKAERDYDLIKVAHQYADLYSQILEQTRAN